LFTFYDNTGNFETKNLKVTRCQKLPGDAKKAKVMNEN